MKRLLLLSFTACALILASLSPVLANHGFRVLNNGRHVIVAIQIAAPGRGNYAPNLLRYRLNPGGSAAFNIGEGCNEDIKITYGNGHWIQQNNVNTCRINVVSNY